MSDIVERLRDTASCAGCIVDRERAAEAADTITRLTAENEKLGRDYQSARDAHDKVLAENEKLRAALKWYAEKAEGCRKLGSIGDPFRHALDADGGKRARAALSGDNNE